VTDGERKAIEMLQGRFHDMAIWMAAGDANGKMIPNLKDIGSICRDMSKLCSVLKILLDKVTYIV